MTRGDPLPTALPYLEDNENDPIDLSAPEPTVPPAEEQEVAPPAPVDPAPQDEASPEPQAAPPAPDLNTQFQQVLEIQRQNAELQRQQLERVTAPQPQQYVPLQSREEWRARYENALSASGYDETARRELLSMNQELVQEQVQLAMQPMQHQVQLEMRGEQALRSSFTQARQQYGDGISEADFMAVAQDVFGGNRAALAQALDPQMNPNAVATQRILAEAAAGRAFLAGRLRPAAPAAPPPAPRGGARPANPAQPGRTSNDMWSDTNYVDGVMADLYRSNR